MEAKAGAAQRSGSRDENGGNTEAVTAQAGFEEWSKPRPELAAQAANWLGAIQLARKAYPEAAALLLPDSDRLFAPVGDISPNERRLAVGHILNLYQALGKPEQAAVLQKKLDALPKP